ncbi:MAG: rhodanese-like domain-containing protein [Colwellia sp.]|nr:rhodanese-like domain-containing protein [Colwellia sp.]
MDQLITFAGNHTLLSAAWTAIVVMIIIITIRIQMSPIKKISTQELTFLVNRQEGVIVDIRTEKEFKASRIIDSKNLVKEKVTNNDFATLENYKDKPIIVVCTAGITAATVASQMLKAGFTKVSLLKGGMNSWVNAGLPLVKK